jgi:mannose-1-phosphate guanylyltransferase
MPTRTAASARKRQVSAHRVHPVLPVLLCPVSDGLLWPLSRQDFPDMFVPIDGDLSAFDLALKAAEATGAGRLLVSIGEPHRFLASEAVERHGLDATIMLTASALCPLDAALIAALNAVRGDADATLALIPVGPRHQDLDALRWMTRQAAADPAPDPASSGDGIVLVRASALLDLAERGAPASLKRCLEAFAAQTVDPPFVRPGRLVSQTPHPTLDELLARSGAASQGSARHASTTVPAIDAVAATGD